MKKIVFILLIIFPFTINGQMTYYWDCENGLDGNDGLSSGNPKSGLATFNGYADTCVEGTIFKFNRGTVCDEWEVYIDNTNTINIEAYGTGDKPVWSGEKDVTLISQGGNIYRVIDSDFLQRDGGQAQICPWVMVDGERCVYSDAKDSGEYYIQTSGSSTWISDNTQSWTTNEWEGAQIWIGRIGTADYTLYTATITSNTDTTLTFSAGSRPSANFNPWSGGQFKEGLIRIMNTDNANALNSNLEYFHRDDTISVYLTSVPTETRVAVIDTLVTFDGASVNMANIHIRGANFYGIKMINDAMPVLDSVIIEGCGKYAIRNSGFHDGYDPAGFVEISNCAIKYSNGGIFNYYTQGCRVDSTWFKWIGVDHLSNKDVVAFEGNQCILMRSIRDYNVIKRNLFQEVCMVTQQHNTSAEVGTGAVIVENYVTDYGVVLGDIGAMYSVNDSRSSQDARYSKNTIVNARQRSTNESFEDTPGRSIGAIYCDEETDYHDVDSNTIVNSGWAIQLHNAENNNFRGNNITGINPVLISKLHAGAIIFNEMNPTGTAQNNTVTYNNAALRPDRNVVNAHNYYSAAIPSGTTLDYNNYSNENGFTIYTLHQNYDADVDSLTFDDMVTLGTYEQNSDTVDYPYDSARVFINNSATSHEFSLGDGVYKKFDGTTVSETLTIPAFYSEIVFLINSDETGRDDLIYIDYNLFPLYVGQSTPEADASDTIWFAIDADSFHKTVADTSVLCSDSAVIYQESYSTEASGSDTVARVNFNYSIYGDVTGWTSLYGSEDSIEIMTDVYLINWDKLSAGSPGETSGSIWPYNVAYYYHYIPATDYDPRYFTIRGSGLNENSTYELWFASSRDLDADRETYFYCNGDGDTVQSCNNTSNWAYIQNIAATGDSIRFSVDRPNGQYGYINGLKLVENSINDTTWDDTQAYFVVENIALGTPGYDQLRIEIEYGVDADTYITLDSLDGDTIAVVTYPGTGCRLRTYDLSGIISGTHDLYITADSLNSYVYGLFILQPTSQSNVGFTIKMNKYFRINSEAVRFRPY